MPPVQSPEQNPRWRGLLADGLERSAGLALGAFLAKASPVPWLARVVETVIDPGDLVPRPHGQRRARALCQVHALVEQLPAVVPPQARHACEVQRELAEALLGQLLECWAEAIAVATTMIVADSPGHLWKDTAGEIPELGKLRLFEHGSIAKMHLVGTASNAARI
eukprot:CAMPEP_0179119416 /NCGR_PEP_ID=MMETSP0796-20121207/56212_1 /TAXON_ID=73915 /ORGANISM="Pyrodinium bahamense, Strain pbaha01" /LENGTH=164 /DNA_ID=CAMNT_0020817913 /DNA_START=272 /DNA_END=763 /DNA_ORIENTATION=+